MESLSVFYRFNRGWAHCQNQGKSCGDIFVALLKDDFAEMSKFVEHDKGSKMTDDIM